MRFDHESLAREPHDFEPGSLVFEELYELLFEGFFGDSTHQFDHELLGSSRFPIG